jgi:acetyl esterase/lipase
MELLSPKPRAPAIPDANRNRLLVHVHGGGYVYNPGEAGTGEAALMAAYGGFKVISFDYRMPPDAPYPAAMDDAMAVWKAALQMQEPRNMAIFGTSTGGGMTLAMILRAKQELLPLPAAIAPGTLPRYWLSAERLWRQCRFPSTPAGSVAPPGYPTLWAALTSSSITEGT